MAGTSDIVAFISDKKRQKEENVSKIKWGGNAGYNFTHIRIFSFHAHLINRSNSMVGGGVTAKTASRGKEDETTSVSNVSESWGSTLGVGSKLGR